MSSTVASPVRAEVERHSITRVLGAVFEVSTVIVLAAALVAVQLLRMRAVA
jgi:hypothetical protein